MVSFVHVLLLELIYRVLIVTKYCHKISCFLLQQSQINSDVVYNVEVHTLLITDISISIELVHFHFTQKVICMLRFLCFFCFLVIHLFCFVGVLVPDSIPSWSLANRTLRNITNNSDMQPVNRPVNTGHVRNVNQCSYNVFLFFL